MITDSRYKSSVAVSPAARSLRRRAGGDPGRQDLARLRGYLGDVARGHGVRADGVDLDQACVAADVLRIVEHDAVGGCMDAGPERLLAVAHAAACQHRILGGLDVER